MAFDNYPPGVTPSDVGSENEPEECLYCGREVYETGADTVSLGAGIDLFCDEDCRTEYVEEEWEEAISNDERLPERLEEFVRTEMIN